MRRFSNCRKKKTYGATAKRHTAVFVSRVLSESAEFESGTEPFEGRDFRRERPPFEFLRKSIKKKLRSHDRNRDIFFFSSASSTFRGEIRNGGVKKISFSEKKMRPRGSNPADPNRAPRNFEIWLSGEEKKKSGRRKGAEFEKKKKKIEAIRFPGPGVEGPGRDPSRKSFRVLETHPKRVLFGNFRQGGAWHSVSEIPRRAGHQDDGIQSGRSSGIPVEFFSFFSSISRRRETFRAP
ncbi:hypothetical protein TNCT_512021 [Trichonephila clavata]|uniref:Uncharacterized protein n=1 Tax=Trichonephila clavata TaxID=2740835 RepID=A0A8X6GD63_TRICU|nr:hypothetical protein TNCT_512021 [Trichonephila clavata]